GGPGLLRHRRGFVRTLDAGPVVAVAKLAVRDGDVVGAVVDQRRRLGRPDPDDPGPLVPVGLLHRQPAPRSGCVPRLRDGWGTVQPAVPGRPGPTGSRGRHGTVWVPARLPAASGRPSRWSCRWENRAGHQGGPAQVPMGATRLPLGMVGRRSAGT